MGSLLLTSRRGFITRALGFTAAGASVAVPVLALASADERLKHHLAGVGAAFGDLFPGIPVAIRGNCPNGEEAAHYREMWERDPQSHRACATAIVYAGPICGPPNFATG